MASTISDLCCVAFNITYIYLGTLTMKPPKISLAPLLALIFAGNVHLHSVDIHPGRVTGIVGGEVQINCEVEFGPNLEMSWDFNNKFLYIITNDVENYPRGTSKYSVHRTIMNFTLSVRDLKLEDGGEYMCTSFTSEATAFLVVLDTPSITFNPPAPKEGETAKFTCEARFGGPKKDLILPGHHPNLKMYLNENSPNEMVTANDTSDFKKHYLISMTKNLRVHVSMNNKHIICEIGTAEPLKDTSVSAVLHVLYSVRDIHIMPDQEKYEVGDIISCFAYSNPAATYEWKKVQGGSTIYGNQLKITDDMNGENNWECVARNVINGEWFEKRMQKKVVADDPSKSGNNSPAVVSVVFNIISAILIIIAAGAFIFRKKILKIYLERSRTININPDSHLELVLVEAEHLLAPMLGPWECIYLLRNVKDNLELNRHGKEILRVLQEDRKSILENDPNILTVLIKKADKLIDSEYYEEIIKVAPHGGKDSPLMYLLGILWSGEENFKKLFKDQKKLMSVIQIISAHGDVQYRTECLNDIILTRTFSGNEYRFEWSEEYLSTLKELLENGADPTWIHPEDLKKERKDRGTAQTQFFVRIFVNLWEKNDLHESLLRVLPLMLSKKCKDNELLGRTLLHRFVELHHRWDYVATNRGSMPPDFFRQFQNILREILRRDGTLLVQKDFLGWTPLQYFLIKIKLEERIFGEVREIIQMLQTQEVLSSQSNSGQTALHSLAFFFPVIRGEVTQSGRESFLELVKSFANESNVGCQDIGGGTALHWLAGKFPGEISEESREVYQDFVKHLATYDILEIKDEDGDTALHYLAYTFTFEIEDWKMETFVEVLKCLAVPRTICIKNQDGRTALEIITNDWGNKVPEHYKDKFQEISDILSENN